MFKAEKSIIVTAWLAAVYYLVLTAVFTLKTVYAVYAPHALFCAMLSLSLVVVAVLLLHHKEFTRQLFLVLAAGLSLYVAVLNVAVVEILHPAIVLGNLLFLLFFLQSKVRILYQGWMTNRKSILVIDDDEGLQKTVKSALLKNGYSVLLASSGERGLQVARLQRPDLIVLDVILPGIKGREVCAILKDEPKTRNIPVIFLTAKDSPDDIRAEMELGAESHMTKPVDVKVLLVNIREILQD